MSGFNDPPELRAEIGAAHRQVAEARRKVTAIGDLPEAWELAALATDLERAARVLEAELDAEGV